MRDGALADCGGAGPGGGGGGVDWAGADGARAGKDAGGPGVAGTACAGVCAAGDVPGAQRGADGGDVGVGAVAVARLLLFRWRTKPGTRDLDDPSVNAGVLKKVLKPHLKTASVLQLAFPEH